MAAPVTFKLTGMAELEKKLGDLKPAVAKSVCVKALKAGGEPVARAARDKVRERYGDLRESIDVGQRLSRRQAAENRKESDVEVYVGPGPFPQAITEEFGTVHETGSPFMRPAWDEKQLEALDLIGATLGIEIDKRAGR